MPESFYRRSPTIPPVAGWSRSRPRRGRTQPQPLGSDLSMRIKSFRIFWCLFLFLSVGNCRSQTEDSLSVKQHVIGDLLLQLSSRQFIAPLISIEYGSPVGSSFSSRYLLAVSEIQEYGFVRYLSLILNPGLKGCRLAIGYWLSLVQVEKKA